MHVASGSGKPWNPFGMPSSCCRWPALRIGHYHDDAPGAVVPFTATPSPVPHQPAGAAASRLNSTRAVAMASSMSRLRDG